MRRGGPWGAKIEAGGDPGGSRSMVTPPRFSGEGRGRCAASAVRGRRTCHAGPGGQAVRVRGRRSWRVGLGWQRGERERPTRSWAVREVERAQLGFGAGASEVSGLGESRLGRAREGKEGVGRGFGWARLGLGFRFGFGFLF